MKINKIYQQFKILTTISLCALCPEILMAQDINLYTTGPSLLLPDGNEQKDLQNIKSFLINLRKNGQLVYKSEINPPYTLREIRSKPIMTAFGRLVGSLFIKRAIEKLGSQNVKVPHKMMLLSDGTENLSLDWLGRQSKRNLEFVDQVPNPVFYVQDISKVDRLLNLNEIKELVAVLLEVGYSDIWDHNFIISHDGIYFIDTEYKSFGGEILVEEKINRLEKMVAEKDKPAFRLWISEIARSYFKKISPPPTTSLKTPLEFKLNDIMDSVEPKLWLR